MINLALVLAAVSSAFNLTCSGTIETESLSGTSSQPYSYLYHIDLAKKKYCEDKCLAIEDIAEIQPSFLRLTPEKDINTSTQKEFESGTIDRTTGKHEMVYDSGRGARIIMMKWDGQCTKSDFTGFPTPVTKF